MTVHIDALPESMGASAARGSIVSYNLDAYRRLAMDAWQWMHGNGRAPAGWNL
ncbi:MAG: hypothetical protein WDZ49_13860 [Litorilinea sp.]